jgi:hypothetical protein
LLSKATLERHPPWPEQHPTWHEQPRCFVYDSLDVLPSREALTRNHYVEAGRGEASKLRRCGNQVGALAFAAAILLGEAEDELRLTVVDLQEQQASGGRIHLVLQLFRENRVNDAIESRRPAGTASRTRRGRIERRAVRAADRAPGMNAMSGFDSGHLTPQSG